MLDDYDVTVSKQTKQVLDLKKRHQQTWRDKPERKWLIGLIEEIIELALALIGLHAGPVDHELAQIASICMNWQEYRRDRRQRD
jgi:hypothetical protein